MKITKKINNSSVWIKAELGADWTKLHYSTSGVKLENTKGEAIKPIAVKIGKVFLDNYKKHSPERVIELIEQALQA